MALTPPRLPRFEKRARWLRLILRGTRPADAKTADEKTRLDKNNNQREDQMSLTPKFAAIAAFGLATFASAAANAAWQPTKPIEFIATAGPGGGSDNFARA